MKTKGGYYDEPKGCEHKLVRLFYFMFALVVLFGVLRCEQQKDCYVCTVKTQWFRGDFIVTSERDYPYCDVDEEWINNFEIINTYSDTTTNIVQTCKCK
jgi:hypothetical protein